MILFKEKNMTNAEQFEVKLKEYELASKGKLLGQFDILNAYLEQKKASVLIDVCKGTNEYPYKIKEYKLNFIDKCLILNLELILKSDEVFNYVMKFEGIKEIKFIIIDKNLKVTIYMIEDTMRFFLKDIHSLNKINRSNTESYKRQFEEYEKFKYSNPLMYYYNNFKFKYKNQIKMEKKYEFDNNSSYYLLMIESSTYNTEIIYLITKDGEHASVYFYTSDKHLYIVDIVHTVYNKGVGTNAILMLIDYAKGIGVSKITGELSNVDDDHKNRRDHFYEKLGFKLEPNSINLDISKNKEFIFLSKK